MKKCRETENSHTLDEPWQQSVFNSKLGKITVDVLDHMSEKKYMFCSWLNTELVFLACYKIHPFMYRIMSWLAHFEACLLSSGRRCIFLVENTGRGTEKISGFYRDTCFKNTTNPLLQFSMKNVIETHVKEKYRRCCNVDRHLFPFCAETSYCKLLWQSE